LFQKYFDQFWSKVENKFTENNHAFILLKIKYNNGNLSTIGKVQRLNIQDKFWYIDFIIENMKFKSEYYNETQIDSLIFSYGFKSGKIKIKENININIIYQNYKNYNLPISINPNDYGRIIIQNGNNYILQNNNGMTINFNTFDNYNLIELFKEGISLIKFRDDFISENKFVRILDNKKYYFENGEQILFTKEVKTKFIKTINKDPKLTNKFLTLDIETYIQDGVLIPFCISIYDGTEISNFWLTDFNNVEELVISALKSLLRRKYNGWNVYIHNMAKFDIIFLFKYLSQIANIYPLIHNDRIISIMIQYGDKKKQYKLKFRDSYLILLNSLSDLCKSFQVDTPKLSFPIFFVNENNLNYEGEVPDQKFFNKIKKSIWLEYFNSYSGSWNLRNEAIKYCNIDCISLHQVISKFNELIFKLFELNIHNFQTLPSLAFAIFRSQFMGDENIPKLSGKISENIRQGYTGGAVDMYIPKGKNIYCYDVNSLYPSQMQSKDMPVGQIFNFEGDITLIDPKAFGFFYCKITAPDNIKHPILQKHVKTGNGIRTISPIGTWEGMLFSEEINNAKRFGYEFEILWGYTFERSNIFKNYVDFLYNLRLQYDKSNPLNFIAKILLNSLYGRFGMNDNFEDINVIHKNFYNDFENKFIDQITEKIEVDDYFIVFTKASEGLIEDQSEHNVSVGIASAITSYSRIHMSQFKNNPDINLYYTDTDSIYTDSNIDKSLINNKVLGKLKLENVCEKAIFLSPKLYALLTESGQFIHKVKGLNQKIDINFDDFKKLLTKDTIIAKTQSKWFRSLSESKINILDQLYSIKTTSNKRLLVYDKNNKLIGTKSYKIDNSKEITKKKASFENSDKNECLCCIYLKYVSIYIIILTILLLNF
jgi:DNA polymerase type B, organellar and viral